MGKARLAAVIMLACGSSAAALAAEPPVQITTVAEGLNHPWSLAFLPGGAMLVTERDGGLRIIRDGKLVPEPVAGVPAAYVAGQAGLFDVLLHPEFATNGVLFLSFAGGTPEANALEVIRARFDGRALTDVQTIYRATPAQATAVHYGGRMAFLPDGTLLVTTGDGWDHREDAQRLDNDFGKIIRINQDGTPPADNPFAGREGARDEIWTYGHRNAQGIVVERTTGAVYAHEHGPRGGDEVNLIERGRNYGWPVITRGVDYTGALISPFTEFEGMEQPLVDWTPSIAPSGLAIYDGTLFPEWRGDLLATALVDKCVYRIDLENGQVRGQEKLFESIGERLRDVRIGPDGAIYLLTDSAEGKVLRITPQ